MRTYVFIILILSYRWMEKVTWKHLASTPRYGNLTPASYCRRDGAMRVCWWSYFADLAFSFVPPSHRVFAALSSGAARFSGTCRCARLALASPALTCMSELRIVLMEQPARDRIVWYLFGDFGLRYTEERFLFLQNFWLSTGFREGGQAIRGVLITRSCSPLQMIQIQALNPITRPWAP